MNNSPSKDPLHGVTLDALIHELVDVYGWSKLGQRINIRCFTHDPSVKSSLKFLRKTPWARKKAEALYIEIIRQRNRPKVSQLYNRESHDKLAPNPVVEASAETKLDT